VTDDEAIKFLQEIGQPFYTREDIEKAKKFLEASEPHRPDYFARFPHSAYKLTPTEEVHKVPKSSLFDPRATEKLAGMVGKKSTLIDELAKIAGIDTEGVIRDKMEAEAAEKEAALEAAIEYHARELASKPAGKVMIEATVAAEMILLLRDTVKTLKESMKVAVASDGRDAKALNSLVTMLATLQKAESIDHNPFKEKFTQAREQWLGIEEFFLKPLEGYYNEDDRKELLDPIRETFGIPVIVSDDPPIGDTSTDPGTGTYETTYGSPSTYKDLTTADRRRFLMGEWYDDSAKK
jgi:hypothetical protein